MPRLKNMRHERFAQNYCANGFNGAKAARSVGVTTRSSSVQASKWLANSNIFARVQEIIEKDDQLFEMTKEETIAEINKLAKFNMQQLYDDDGRIMPLHEMDEAIAVGVNEITYDRTGQVESVKCGKDKRAALDMLMKHHNQYEQHQKSGEIHIHFDEKDKKA